MQRLVERVGWGVDGVHLVMSAYAREVAKQELDSFKIPAEVSHHSESDMNVPFVSGSARFDAMVIVPCSMATLGRIASGSSDSVLLRAADVFLKERRKLILVPRETPWNLIHARNVVTLLEAGAVVLPASPDQTTRGRSSTCSPPGSSAEAAFRPSSSSSSRRTSSTRRSRAGSSRRWSGRSTRPSRSRRRTTRARRPWPCATRGTSTPAAPRA